MIKTVNHFDQDIQALNTSIIDAIEKRLEQIGQDFTADDETFLGNLKCIDRNITALNKNGELEVDGEFKSLEDCLNDGDVDQDVLLLILSSLETISDKL